MHPLGLDSVLRKYAHGVGPYSSIVEVGSWCGASAFQLAEGSGSLTDIHLYDRWKTNAEECRKIMQQTGEMVGVGYDLEPMIRYNLREFGDRIHYHKGNIFDAQYDGRWDIGLYVDDASKNQIDRVLPKFEPRFGLGCTLILMDYHESSCRRLREYMQDSTFERVDDVPGASIWRYR